MEASRLISDGSVSKNSGKDTVEDLFDHLVFRRGTLSGDEIKGTNDSGVLEEFLYPPRWTGYEYDPDLFIGIALGLAISNCYVPVGNGIDKDIRDLVKSYGPRTIFQLTDDRREFDLEMMKASDVVEIDYTIPEGPSILPELGKRKDIGKLVELLKEITGSKIAVRIPAIDLQDDIDHVLVTDIDIVVVDCNSADPGPRSIPHPVLSTLITMQRMEIFHSRKKGVELVIDCNIRNHEDIVKLISLGADMIGTTSISGSFLNSSAENKDWAEIGESFNEMIDTMGSKVNDLLWNLSGYSLERLREQGLQASDYDTASKTGLPLLGYGKVLPIWRH